MKKFLLKSSAAFLLISVACINQSCGDKNNITPQEAAEATVSSKVEEGLPNYRYVDTDTILSKYNLAKDYREEMNRMQDNMETQVKRHENSIQSFANTMQNKMQNNGYLSEASFNSDQEKLNNMRVAAQNDVAKLQNQFEAAALASNKAVIDSIHAFIEIYNAKKGYDAIFLKDATMYINPALDITDEIVEGLNARYNKVK